MLINCPDNFDLSFARELLSSFGADVSIICPGDCWGHLAEKFAEYRPQVEAYFECATTGNPAYGAMCMARECGSSREWAERVTEAATTGDSSYVAFRLANNKKEQQKWLPEELKKEM